MKTIFITLAILLAGDVGLYSGAYSLAAWRATKSQLHAIQVYADEATASLTGG